MIHVWKHTWWKVNLTRYQYLSYHQSLPDGSCELKLHGFLERTAFSKIVMFSTSQAPLTDRQTLNFKLTRYLFALQRFSTVKLEKECKNIQNIKVKKKNSIHVHYMITTWNILSDIIYLLHSYYSLKPDTLCHFWKKNLINILFYVSNPFFDKIYILLVCFKISIKLILFHTCF